MTRRYIVWISLVSLTAAVVLNTSMQTRQQQDHLAEVKQQITAEQERIRVLTAEWHSLKTPERLEELAHRHLQGYGTIKPMQMATLGDVPERLPGAPVATPAVTTAIAAATPAVPTARQVASVATPRARPVARPAAQPAPKPDDALAQLITQDQAPTTVAQNDGIRTIIERQPALGVLWASAERAQ